MALHIVPYYAAVLAVLFIVLAQRVIAARGTERVALGVGQSQSLERRVRVHANFAEYVPFALLLLAMAELRGANALALNLLCAALVLGRLAHAWGVSRTPENFRWRVGGMATTLTVLAGASLLMVVS